MKSIKGNSGITLITLAVTIVVILILAGVTLDVTLGENGILNKSKEAANIMNNLVKEDEAELNDLLNELNETMDSNWNSNVEIPDPEPAGENIGDLIDNGIIKVGDYVAYNPIGAASYTVNGAYSGTGIDQTINKENLNWRVLDKTEDGKVRLISANPTASTVKLQGANGYNNAVYLLDELCNTLYKGNNATAKSLKIEDIQNKMNLSVWNYNNYANYGVTFSPNGRQYPLIFAQEKGQIVNGSTGSLGLSEQTSIITGSSTASSWTVRHTDWTNNSIGASNYVQVIYYELFHTAANNNRYWLSSRCVNVDAVYNNAYFDVRCVSTNYVDGVYTYIFAANGGELPGTFGVRPVVYLESSVKIDTEVEGKDGLTPETAWEIAE